MSYRYFIAGLFLFVTAISAQPAAEKIINELEVINDANYNNWKYSTDMSYSAEELSNSDFDDSEWKTLRINESIFQKSCWLRKEIEIPEYVGGIKITPGVYFQISVDDYGFLYINGIEKGRFNWDGEYQLADNARAGDKFVLVVKAINTGGPLRLLRARLNFGGENSFKQSISDFILSVRTGLKLLSFDTYQTNNRVKVDPGIDKSSDDRGMKEELAALLNEAVSELDVDALRSGDVEEFKESFENVRKQLKPVADFAKKFTLHFTANAHIDAAWLWRKKETVDVCYHTFSSVMNMYRARTDETRTNFAYAQSQAAFYEWMRDLYPDLFGQIQEKVNEGNWELTGGMWVEPDCNLPDGVSWSRQLLYGQKFFENNLGKRAVIGWNPDSFGYTWNMPQFYLNSGMDVFITQKIGWNDTSVFPYRVFWWEAPDGSRILSYFPFSYVNSIDNPYHIIDWLRQFEANTGYKNMLVLFGVGNHGGGPSIEMMKRIDRLTTLDIFPNIVYGTSREYIDWLKKQDLEELPVWKDELYLEYHRGTYTTQSDTKKNNRKGEVLLTNAEKFASIANLNGMDYPQEYLKSAWKKVMFNQFHDILPGSSIREVYQDADRDYKKAFELGNYSLQKSIESIASDINTSSIKQGKPVVVFNSLSWSRSDVVKLKLPEGDKGLYEVYTPEGEPVASQYNVKDELNREIIFIAEDVPSLGYKTYELRKKEGEFKEKINPLTVSALQEDPPKVVDAAVENEYFKITVDTDSGWVKSIYDKVNNKELLTGCGNKLQLLEDIPSEYEAWNIGYTGKEFPTTFRKVELLEKGPVKNVIRIYRDYLKPGSKKRFPTEDFPNSFFTQDIILYNGIDRIDFVTSAEWFEEKTLVKVLFPLSVSDTVATYEIPYGTIKRSTTLEGEYDKGKWEVAALRWADISDDNYGVSLLNKAKYGYDIKGSDMRLTLLRSPKSPDETADMGFHKMEYSLYPHTGDIMDARTVRHGYEYNNELIAVIAEPSDGRFPMNHSFAELNPENLVLTSIKKAEEADNVFVYQFYETDGVNTKAELKLPGKPVKAEYTNFLEDNGEPIKLRGNRLNVNVRANGIMTIKVSY